MERVSITPEGEIIVRDGSEIPLSVKAGIPPPKRRTKKDEQDIIGIEKFYRVIPDEAAAIAFVEERIWGGTPWCPRCGRDDTVYRTKNGRPMSHRCRTCEKYFSVRTGTILAETNLPVRKWLLAIHLMHTDRKGMSSIQLSKMLDITQKTAWFLEHRIREAMREGNVMMGDVIQVDECYIGGKERWKHANKKLHERWPEGKIAVIGFKEDGIGGKVVAFPIWRAGNEDIEAAVLDFINPGSIIYSDSHPAYNRLTQFGYHHGTVNHHIGQYVDNMISTNGIESFWAVLRGAYRGTYHYMSWRHLHRYINECAARHNIGHGNGFETIGVVLERSVGRRLTHKRLTAKPAGMLL